MSAFPCLVLPGLTEADPDLQAEGSIDPLGLATLGDLLADTIAPGVAARMTRPRLITAIATTAVLVESLSDRSASDGVSPAWLVAEWHVVESLVRSNKLPDSARRGVPGTAKTRLALSKDERLNARNYLKSPKVFGFHGVFKRLATHLGVVDDSLVLTGRGRDLVLRWEQEQGLDGFLEGAGGDGAAFRRRLHRAIERALADGQAQKLDRPTAVQLAESLRPDCCGRAESQLLWGWLTDRTEDVRREILIGLNRLGDAELSERDALSQLRGKASSRLGERLDAIDAYERLSCTLTRAFDACRVLGRQYGNAGIRQSRIESAPEVADAAETVRAQYEEARRLLEPLGLVDRLELLLADLVISSSSAPGFTVALFEHHENVQSRKPPAGKRPWFERIPSGFIVRPAYALDRQSFEHGQYVHPMRVAALRTFCADLRT